MFRCNFCNVTGIPLSQVADLPCSCLSCKDCAVRAVDRALKASSRCHGVQPPSQNPPATRLAPLKKGDAVWYINRHGAHEEAIVQQVDRTCDPPQYGVQLPDAADLRFTERQRLILMDEARPGAQPGPYGSTQFSLDVWCAACKHAFQLRDLRAIAPKSVAAWELACTEAWERAHNIITCPHAGCGAKIQRVPQQQHGSSSCHGGAGPSHRVATPRSGLRSGGSNGAGTSHGDAASAAHREAHRYRCSACGHDFCDLCRAAPYHNGLTCGQACQPDCLLCGGKVEEDRAARLLPCTPSPMETDDDGVIIIDGSPGPRGARQGCDGSGAAGPSKQEVEASARALAVAARLPDLRAALQQLEVDTSWCLERTEFQEALLHWGLHTCSKRACAAKLKGFCTRQLPCRHWCCGVRGEDAHPPCVTCRSEGRGVASTSAGAAGSASVAGAGTDCPYCWSPLTSSPCLALKCGHMCHIECAVARLAAGFPGPNISFHYLNCPLCGSGEERSAGSQVSTGPVALDHPLLAAQLAPHLELRADVVAAAKARLRMEPSLRDSPELQPGGRYDGRPADLALAKLLFFKCNKCSKPYFGGLRSCGAGGAGDAGPDGGGEAYNAAELLCNECCARAAGSNCPRHGTSYIEWKCRYCCSVASWFCFGTTHMCHACHSDGTYQQGRAKPCNPATCVLGAMPHPPPNQELFLGCGMCRAGL